MSEESTKTLVASMGICQRIEDILWKSDFWYGIIPQGKKRQLPRCGYSQGFEDC
jgi:hypothetical protein